MQIRRLVIDNYNCLVNFEIGFNISQSEGSSTILIGENGTGKSTLLERIIEILMSFRVDSIEENINYGYELEYLYKGSNISIYQYDHHYRIDIGYHNVCTGKIQTVRRYIKDGKISILPERISYFYSGLNNKVLRNIKKMDSLYKAECIATVAEYWRATVWAGQEYRKQFPKRRYNYCDDSLTEIYLLSILGGNNSTEQDYLHNQCHMGKIDSIAIELDTEKMRISLADDVTNENLSWFFEITEFIDNDLSPVLESGFVHAVGNKLYFRIENVESFEKDSIAVFNFFEKLATIFDADYSVTISIGNSSVNCNDLSEGQRQLIKMLGMLGVCKTEDSLVLMDEPDAHMNPKWKYEIKETIDRSLEEAVNTQALIATHDPLVINGVPKEFIRIFTHNQTLITDAGYYHTQVIVPTEDTEGMGIDGLLQSEYYRLRTSYDKKATDKFLRRQELYEKLINKDISTEEKAELRALTKEVASMQMSRNSIDFLYDDFIKVFRQTEYFEKEYLSFDEMQERRDKIKEIIKALYEGQV